MKIAQEEISALLKNRLEQFEFKTEGNEVGSVVETADGIARITGLPSAMLGEMLEFPNKIYGIVFNLEANQVVVIILGKKTAIKIGDSA
ncbi:F0F1 ATP synthase subunit alpha, partial [bacterium]|nr:F0F1 ATP synthase subunit alpha [bacterium]